MGGSGPWAGRCVEAVPLVGAKHPPISMFLTAVPTQFGMEHFGSRPGRTSLLVKRIRKPPRVFLDSHSGSRLLNWFHGFRFCGFRRLYERGHQTSTCMYPDAQPTQLAHGQKMAQGNADPHLLQFYSISPRHK